MAQHKIRQKPILNCKRETESHGHLKLFKYVEFLLSEATGGFKSGWNPAMGVQLGIRIPPGPRPLFSQNFYALDRMEFL